MIGRHRLLLHFQVGRAVSWHDQAVVGVDDVGERLPDAAAVGRHGNANHAQRAKRGAAFGKHLGIFIEDISVDRIDLRIIFANHDHIRSDKRGEHVHVTGRLGEQRLEHHHLPKAIIFA